MFLGAEISSFLGKIRTEDKRSIRCQVWRMEKGEDIISEELKEA